MSYSGYKATK